MTPAIAASAVPPAASDAPAAAAQAAPLLAHIDPLFIGLTVALGCGLLIGLERERRKARDDERDAAGIRSFTLVTLAGALTQALGQPALSAVGAIVIGLLATIAYHHGQGRPQADSGMTTELALMVSYLIGALAIERPLFAAGAAALVTVLLASRGRLHYFAKRILSEDELHDGLMLAALTLLLLPLMPREPMAWLGGLQPNQVLTLVLLILALQAAGHVALRLFGTGAGLPLAGLMSGFVSSTATVASMGGRLRATPALARACTAGAMLSTAATWTLALVLLVALSPRLSQRLWPALVLGAVIALAFGAVQAGFAQRRGRVGKFAPTLMRPPTGELSRPADEEADDDGDSDAETRTVAPSTGRALRLPEALMIAALLSGVTVLVSLAQRHLGSLGAVGGAALAGIGDSHSGIAALGAVSQQGSLAMGTAAAGVLLTIGTNSVTRIVTAAATGGRAYALRVGACLLVALGCATLLAWATGAFA